MSAFVKTSNNAVMCVYKRNVLVTKHIVCYVDGDVRATLEDVPGM